jgi:hypothetical protein
MVAGQPTLAFNDVATIRVPGHPVCLVQLHVDGHPFVRYGADAAAAGINGVLFVAFVYFVFPDSVWDEMLREWGP